MAIVNTPEEAFTFLQGQIDILRKKSDELNPTIKKLLPYQEAYPIFQYGLEYVNNEGAYVSAGYFRKNYQEDWKTVDEVVARRDAIIGIVDKILPAVEATRLKNLEIIEHNKAVVEKIKLIMKTMGIPDGYTERDTKSRARNPKYISRSAGYLEDIRRNVSLTDTGYYNLKTRVDRIKATMEAWAVRKTKAIRDEEEAKKRDAAYVAKIKFLARLSIKYGVDDPEDETELLEAILERNKYLHLAHYLLRNRNDWNDGPDRAEYGLDNFKIDSEQDQEIYDTIWALIDDWDGDGRCFRDCKWGYGEIFGLVDDDDLYTDYNNLVEMFPDLTNG